MGSRYKFFRKVWNKYSEHNQVGFPDIITSEFFNYDDDKKFRITLKYSYRPDLISLDFYGDPKLFWVLVYANNFSNSPEDFYPGRIITIPRYEKIIAVA